MNGGGENHPNFHELPPELRRRLFRATSAMWIWLILSGLLFFFVSNFRECFEDYCPLFRPIHFLLVALSIVGGAGAHFGVFHARMSTRLRTSLPSIGGLLPTAVFGAWAAIGGTFLG